jgi:hypothetical protein
MRLFAILLCSFIFMGCASTEHQAVSNDGSIDNGELSSPVQKRFFQDLCSMNHDGVSGMGFAWHDCSVKVCTEQFTNTGKTLLEIYEFETSVLDEPYMVKAIGIGREFYNAFETKSGLDKKLSFSLNRTENLDSSIIIKPNDSALFYNFTNVKKGETVNPQYLMTCQTTYRKYIPKAVGHKILKSKIQ